MWRMDWALLDLLAGMIIFARTIDYSTVAITMLVSSYFVLEFLRSSTRGIFPLQLTARIVSITFLFQFSHRSLAS